MNSMNSNEYSAIEAVQWMVVAKPRRGGQNGEQLGNVDVPAAVHATETAALASRASSGAVAAALQWLAVRTPQSHRKRERRHDRVVISQLAYREDA